MHVEVVFGVPAPEMNDLIGKEYDDGDGLPTFALWRQKKKEWERVNNA